MTLDKLLLKYKPSEEDVQETTTRKSLVGKWTSYRKRSSLTDSKFRIIPEDDRFDYVRKRSFKSFVREYHDFALQTETPKILLDKDRFFERQGGYHWEIVLTIPRKLVDLHRISQNTEFLVKKICEENYAYLIPEIDRLKHLDDESALRLASTIEQSFNISKLEVDDPFQKRIFEDLQWGMIEIKKILYCIIDKENVEKARNKLTKTVDDLESKMLALEEIKKAFGRLGIDEKTALKEFAVRKLPDGRVELVWKKSG